VKQLESQVAELTRRNERSHVLNQQLIEQLRENRSATARLQRTPSLLEASVPEVGPRLNRAQRRALERRR
jgi:uncharacterized protein YlzI (FlbEa/FlbD family)